MRLGYARVSTSEQNLDLQLRALKGAGCDRIFQDTITGKSRKRPGLNKLMASIKTGDAVVIWRVDRLGRNFYHLVTVAEELRVLGANIVSLTEGIDIATPLGQAIYRIICIFAELEHDNIVSRTRAGLDAARARGSKLGRPRKLSAPQIAEASRLLADHSISPEALAARYGVGRATLYRARSAQAVR